MASTAAPRVLHRLTTLLFCMLCCLLCAAPVTAQDDPLARLLLDLPLSEAIELARALPERREPALAAPIRLLTTAGPGEGGRHELLTRLIIERSLARHADGTAGGDAALASAAGALPRLFEHFSRFDSAMLRAAVWRLAAAAPAAARARIRAASYAAAAALHRRHAENRQGDVVNDPELDAEALAFLAYAATAADPGLTPFVDAIREESRNVLVVRRARAVLAR